MDNVWHTISTNITLGPAMAGAGAAGGGGGAISYRVIHTLCSRVFYLTQTLLCVSCLTCCEAYKKAGHVCYIQTVLHNFTQSKK